MAQKKPAVSSKVLTKNAETKKQKKPRKIKQSQYKSFRVSKRIKHSRTDLPSGYRLLRRSLALLRTNMRVLGGIALVYAILNLLLVRGFGSAVDVVALKDAFSEIFQGSAGKLGGGVTIFGLLLSSSSTPASDVGGAYQTLLVILVSLITIWALRHLVAGQKIGIKEAYYKGLTPAIPFVLVLLVIILQLLPIVLVNFLYTAVFITGIAVTALEQFLWGLLLFLLVIWSLYMITSSLFALYIVTLPDVQPMQALRTARGLVRHRRWMVMRKVLFMPLALLLLGIVIMLPIIFLLPVLAELVFFMLSMIALVFAHIYMYILYRELIRE